MSLTLALVTIDASDAVRLGTFWADVVGAKIHLTESGAYVMLGGGQPGLAFQQVDTPTPGKNKFHLDFATNNIAVEEARLLELGATKMGDFGDSSFRWVQFADLEGNLFDVAIEG
ncbi:VOC family protein [Galactobacter caseinivorans]|uniref:VOC family protein n=1 Tax=Galactobacter caseinivorans TaxID=2676123 RepID=A0A496PMQ5_9MICC|nr:VOC family protein [Galactobacter caseinivorans]RKW71822.1 VOC family protein [Galactobacter caseinivorans]